MAAVAPLAAVDDSVGARASPVHAAYRRAGRRVLARVGGLAALSAAALLYGGASGWTSTKGEDFAAGAGVLLGLGAAAVPASAVGLYVAYGPGSLDGRNRVGFVLLTLIPALLVLGVVAPTLLGGGGGGDETGSGVGRHACPTVSSTL